MIDRKRDISNLTKEQFEALQGKLAGKLSEILSHAALEANQLLNQYGVEVQINYNLVDIETKKPIKAKKSKKA